MNPAALWPSVAMAFLTFAVWGVLFVRRIPAVRRGVVPLDTMSIRATRPVTSPEEAAANDNLMNLFEIPVLFHVLCFAMALTGITSNFLVAGGWGFVGLRGIHLAVHCTVNNVTLRFAAYLLSTLLLFGMWIALARGLAG